MSRRLELAQVSHFVEAAREGFNPLSSSLGLDSGDEDELLNQKFHSSSVMYFRKASSKLNARGEERLEVSGDIVHHTAVLVDKGRPFFVRERHRRSRRIPSVAGQECDSIRFFRVLVTRAGSSEPDASLVLVVPGPLPVPLLGRGRERKEGYLREPVPDGKHELLVRTVERRQCERAAEAGVDHAERREDAAARPRRSA